MKTKKEKTETVEITGKDLHVKTETIKGQKLTIETINADRVFEKKEIKGSIPVPVDHIRVVVLKDYKGMTEELYAGDVLDLPERRYKSLAFRGMVKEYSGKGQPNKNR